MANHAFICKCPKCGRKFFYTFKDLYETLLVTPDGYIDWRCFSCEKQRLEGRNL